MKKGLFKIVGMASILFLGIVFAFWGSFNFSKKEEVVAAANCPDNFNSVADFCISSKNSEEKNFIDAVKTCKNNYSRLCSIGELLVAGDKKGSWADDFVSVDEAIFFETGSNLATTQKTDKKEFYCCRNL